MVEKRITTVLARGSSLVLSILLPLAALNTAARGGTIEERGWSLAPTNSITFNTLPK